MKISEISEDIKSLIKNAANKSNGAERREHTGKIVIKLLAGNVRKNESECG